MTKKEIARLLAVISAAFPRFEANEFKAGVWLELLGDLDYGVAQAAVKKCMLENVYAPSVAEIRRAAAELMFPDRKTGAEAWGEVEKAMRHHGYYGEREALESMSPLTAEVVRYFGWREICLSEAGGVVRGQFLKMYEQVFQREVRSALLPEGFAGKNLLNAGGLLGDGNGAKH